MSTNVTGTEWVPIPDEDLVRFRMFGCWNSGAVLERHEHGTVLVVDITGAVHPLNHRAVEPDPYPTTNPLHGKYVRRAARIL
jgi:hypothetical protein